MGARLDLTTVLGFASKETGVSLVLGVSSWEDPKLNDAAQFVSLTPSNTWSSGPHVTRARNVTGPLAMADVNGDGNLDVFIGGPGQIGRDPEAAGSISDRPRSPRQL